MEKFKIKSESIGEIIAEMIDENPKTSKTFLEEMPITVSAKRWGMEIYCDTSIKLDLENGRKNCKVGEIGYWPDGKGFCIFFGPTPASKDEYPVAATPVNVFAKIISEINNLPELLDKVKPGEIIKIEKK